MECVESGEGESRDIPEPAAGWTAGGFLPNSRQIKRERSYFSSRFQAGERKKKRRFLAHGSGIMGKKRDRWKEKKGPANERTSGGVTRPARVGTEAAEVQRFHLPASRPPSGR